MNEEAKKELEKLEPIQYRDIYYEDDVPFETSSNSIVSRLVYYGAGLLIFLIAASFIVKLPRETYLEFELKGGVDEFVFQYPEKVYIKDISVRPGDNLFKGQELFEIGGDNIADLINEVKTNETQLAYHQQENKKLHEIQMEALEQQVFGLIREQKELAQRIELTKQAKEQETSNLKTQLINLEKQFDRDKGLHDQGVISDLDLEESENRLNAFRMQLISKLSQFDLDLSKLNGDYLKITNSKDFIRKEISELKTEYKARKVELVNILEASKRKISLKYGEYTINNANIILLAPFNAKALFINYNKSEINPDEIIMSLECGQEDLFIYSEASPSQVGKILNGSKAILKFHSFPFYYYGTMKSVVSSISSSPNETGNYPVRFEITDTGKLGHMVKEGMTGQVSVILEERSVADFILRGILKKVTIDPQ